MQLLFTTNGPEGILPIPARGAPAVSSETDKAKKGVRSAVNLHRTGSGESRPSLVSATQNGNALGWTALSALTADPRDAQTLYAASDSALKHAFIYRINLRQTPAVIESARAVTRNGKPAENLDIEGIFKRPQGGFWLASEGKTGAENRIIRTDDNLEIIEEIRLPEDVARHIGKWGLEGITAVNGGGRELLYIAVRRPLRRDPAAKNLETVEGNYARIGQYDTAARSWRWFAYPLESTPAKGDWIGLSEITAVDARTLAVIERDKLNGEAAQIKRIYSVTLPENTSDSGVVPLQKKLALDILPKLRALHGHTQEKPEGFTIAADGKTYAVTDNDGLDNATGETVFPRLGAWR